MNKVKIGVVVDNEFTGDLRVENEVIALVDAGFEVMVLCLNFGSKEKTEDFYGAKIIRVKVPKFFQNKLRPFVNTPFDFYSSLWKFFINKFVKQNKIGILHLHDLYMAKPVLKSALSKNIKLILDLHENYIDALFSYSWSRNGILKLFLKRKNWEKFESTALTRFDKVIVLSEDYKSTLLKKYPFLNSSKFLVYPNYPDHKKMLSYEIDLSILKKENDFIIFYFGVIAKRRGVFTLLEALQKLKSRFPDIKLLIIGPVDKNDEPQFRSFLENKEISENIIYYPWKDIKHFPSYASISDICVSPLVKNAQHESGIANKIFQYMLFAKPLIVSNCIPQARLTKEQECGVVFRSEDPIDLADKIIDLYNSEDLRKRMGENGRKAVLEKYNTERGRKDLVALYETILDGWDNDGAE
jgi:glycosyltransferase involved in cell wall biosynthesis